MARRFHRFRRMTTVSEPPRAQPPDRPAFLRFLRTAPGSRVTCKSCRHFVDDPAELEKAFAGIGALSSAYGSTRGRAGICWMDDTFHDPIPACAEFETRGEG